MKKIALLIDGGFFMRRLEIIFPQKYSFNAQGVKFDHRNPQDVSKLLLDFASFHLLEYNKKLSINNQFLDPFALLYRIFYYDAPPFLKQTQLPVSLKTRNFLKESYTQFRLDLLNILKTTPHFAVREGYLNQEGWRLRETKQKELLAALKTGQSLDELSFSDDDFKFELRQKGVDMRIGLDIASLALKKQVETIIFVSGDGDFIPAAKLARREGLKFHIDIMGQEVPHELLEHADNFSSSFRKPAANYMSHIYWNTP